MHPLPSTQRELTFGTRATLRIALARHRGRYEVALRRDGLDDAVPVRRAQAADPRRRRLIWWAIHQEPSYEGSDGGGGRRRPHPAPKLPHAPRRGPHREAALPSPPRVRTRRRAARDRVADCDTPARDHLRPVRRHDPPPRRGGPDRHRPVGRALVQPASVDLRLGDSFRVFHNHRVTAIDLREPPRNLTEEVASPATSRSPSTPASSCSAARSSRSRSRTTSSRGSRARARSAGSA